MIKKKHKNLIAKLIEIVNIRVPIISGLILFFFPIIAISLGDKMIGNIFAMSDIGKLLSVMVVVSIISNLIVSVYKSHKFISKIKETQAGKNKTLSTIELLIPLLLMAPNFYVLFVKSQNNGIEYFRCWFALGILLSLTIYTLCILYDQRSALNSKIYDLISDPIQRANLNKISSSTKIERITNFFGSDNLKNRRITFLVIQIILGLVLYVWNVSSNYCNLININDNSLFCSVIKITKPIYFPAPAILYLLFILWFFTASLGLLTLWNNGLLFNNQKPKRIPTIMLLLGFFIFCIFSYAAFRADHTFVSLNTNNSNKSNSMEEFREFRTAVDKRIEKTKYKDTLVVIATAGGGIQASGWTAQVLSGLQSSIGEDFTKAIGLISSTSGGSIGTMFYLDQFDEDKGILSQDGLKNVVKSATNNWLPAVGWGLAYPDLVRVLGLPFLNFGGNAVDRGSSLEQLWINDLKHKNKEAMTLSSLHTKIMNGTIPIPIFNSTIVENGHRLLISPLSFPVNNLGTGQKCRKWLQRLQEKGLIESYQTSNKTLRYNEPT